MEQFLGFKISVIVAVVFASLFKLTRVKRDGKTRIQLCVDLSITFAISIIFALFALTPVLAVFGIPLSFEVVTAMILAISAETILIKVLQFIEGFNLASVIEDFIMKKYGVVKKKDANEENNDGGS